MKKRFALITAIILTISMLCGSFVYADENDAKISVNITAAPESVYEDCTGSFEVSVEGTDASAVSYSWYISNNVLAEENTTADHGWYRIGTTFDWIKDSDSAKLSITAPRGYAVKYMGADSLMLRCKATVDGKDYYSEAIALNIAANPYEEGLAFDDQYQVPAIAGDRAIEEIAPTKAYLVKFAAKGLADRFSSDLYTVKAGIRFNGEMAVESDKDYTRLERDYEKGLYLVTEELYLYRNGLKVATSRKEVAINVQDSCNHVWEKKFDTATCGQSGTAYFECKVCHAVKEEESAASGNHDWKVIEKIEKTCTKDGKSVSVCPVCGGIQVVTTPAEGHKIHKVRYDIIGQGSFEVISCENCDYDGSSEEEEESDVCDHKWSESKDSFVAPTCQADGKRVYVCSVCNKNAEVTVAHSEKYHSVGEWVDESTGDCTTQGHRSKECTVCGQTVITETLPADHRWELAEVTYPTCSEGGTITWKCSRCGETQKQSCKADGHKIVHIDAAEGSCITEGIKDHYECSECGAVFEDAGGINQVERSAVYTGFDDTKHIGGDYSYNGNTHYTLCACLTKLDEHRHKFSKGFCKLCGYEQGTMEETKLDIVQAVCDKLGVSEMKLLMILAAVFAVCLIGLIVSLVIFVRAGKKKNKKKEEKTEEDETPVVSIEEASGDEPYFDGEIVDVDDAVMIDWGDDPDEETGDFTDLNDL